MISAVSPVLPAAALIRQPQDPVVHERQAKGEPEALRAPTAPMESVDRGTTGLAERVVPPPRIDGAPTGKTGGRERFLRRLLAGEPEIILPADYSEDDPGGRADGNWMLAPRANVIRASGDDLYRAADDLSGKYSYRGALFDVTI